MLYQTFFSISYQRRFPETRLLEAMTRCFKNGKQELIFIKILNLFLNFKNLFKGKRYSITI